MITGDPALDAWLIAHGHLIAAAIFFVVAAVMFLPGLLALSSEEDEQ